MTVQVQLRPDPHAPVVVVEPASTALATIPPEVTPRDQNLGGPGEMDPMLLRYDPEAIAAHYRDRPAQVFFRCFNVLRPILLFSLSLLWDKQTGAIDRNERKRAVRLREILTHFGPAFIKIGQALSTRPDVLPPVYLEEMTRLQDQLPAFPNEIAFQFIQEELGAHPYDIYAELSPTPVAAASLGQVYRGKLKTGEEVAVKVQRPGLADKITLDIYILRGLAAWAMNKLGSRLKSDLVAIMDEFGERIFDEMDYTQEGRNAERFAQLYGYIKDIYVPTIYWGYTGRRVLTMEWITGLKLTQMAAIEAQGSNPTRLVEVGVQCSLRQLLEHGFFHADPHPGNLLAMPDGRLAYLDFGMMSEIKPYQRYGLIEAVVHLVNRDFDLLAQDYIKLDFLTPDTDLRPIIPALAEVFNNALGSSVAELNFKSMTDQLSELMYEYPFRVPAYYALIIRSLVTLEGIAINVDPEFKVLSKAYPYIAKRLLTDPSPELRASLRDLLFKDGSFRWNRLENLLSNARDSDDYDLDRVLDQTIDFLFSERGEFIREQLVDEVVNSLDLLGRSTLQQMSSGLRSVGDRLRELTGQSVSASNATQPSLPPQELESLERLQRILKILRETQGFDPMKVLQLIPRLLVKPELQSIGQQVASSLAQKTAARLVREVLLASSPATTPATTPVVRPQL
ncbi:MAG: AarF/ABC1/UbiB kinase family protein [Synechococcales cyanobacterium CRU_2_2]|nr:AarF/ABC1/UbiB kinase family protein [Synechococcales cyanobacterium CRU_2_2]